MPPEGRRNRPSAAHWLPLWTAATIALLGVASAASAKPRIHEDPISYGAHRKAEMAAYSHRHYGAREYRLTDPQVIVLHFTATTATAPSGARSTPTPRAWASFPASARTT
jgi:hypothetical protein